MRIIVILLWLLLMLVNSIELQSQIVGERELNASQIWEKLERSFSVPEKYQNKYGSYSSPLKFYDGHSVKTKEDWEKRRKEILNKWDEMMGEWPALIADQKLEIFGSEKREHFIQYKVRFYLLPGKKTEGYLLIPNGKGKKPAVITVFYEPETAIGLSKSPYRDFAYQLAKRGFVTLSIGTTETTQNKTYSLYYPDINDAHIQPISTLAYAAANAWSVLAKVEEVDSTRIGIVGHSYGGKWAMFASCLFDKFACAAWSDPGIVFDETKGSNVNYWEPWYLGYYPPPWEDAWRKIGLTEKAKGIYPKLVKEGYDLHELHSLMAPRPFLVSGGSSDTPERWMALNHSIDVNEFLGYHNRVAMTNRTEHSPNEKSNEQIYLFFEYFLGYDKIHTKTSIKN